MAEHFNKYHLTHFARIVADAMGIELPEPFAPTINWLSNIICNRMNGKADRAVLYHADAVGQYIWQQYTQLFAPVYAHSSLAVPFTSTVMSVTPVAHASMYTGLEPEQHGIQTYVRPQLTCMTLYDVMLDMGLNPLSSRRRIQRSCIYLPEETWITLRSPTLLPFRKKHWSF